MKIVNVEDICKKIIIELSYDEWFEIIYLKEKEKRENVYPRIAPENWGGTRNE